MLQPAYLFRSFLTLAGRYFLLSVLSFCALNSPAQVEYGIYDTDLLPSGFHQSRRQALRQLMPDSSVAVFFSAPTFIRANDVYFPFHQEPNLYYLSGLREPNSVLVIFKEAQEIGDQLVDELLFVQDRNANVEKWTGKRLGTQGAAALLRFAAVYTNTAFAQIPVDFQQFRNVFVQWPRGQQVDDPEDTGDLPSLIRQFRMRYKVKDSVNSNFFLDQYLATLREIKTPEEINLIRKAVNQSVVGHLEVMKALKPGMTEYQAQAIAEYYFSRGGAEAVAYPTIAGGGENSCILHYVTNRKRLDKNNLLVLDAGAEYHGYAADITRTLPANGKFSPEQKILYNIVLEAQLAGIAACKAGNDFRAPHNAAAAVIQKRLLEWGIIKTPGDYMLYFFHGTSHYLGLDVHDAGMYGKLKPNNVITVEPGIYIPHGSPCDPKFWDIGVRIEDDILITPAEPEVLSGNLPKTVAAIETIMMR